MIAQLERLTIFSLPCVLFTYDTVGLGPQHEENGEWSARIRKAILDETGVKLEDKMRVLDYDLVQGDLYTWIYLLVDDDAWLRLRSSKVATRAFDDILNLLAAITCAYGRAATLDEALVNLSPAEHQHSLIRLQLRSLLEHTFAGEAK